MAFHDGVAMARPSFTSLARLHDAMLVSVWMDWASAQVSLFVRTGDDTFRVTFEQVLRLVCPRVVSPGRIGPGLRIHTVRQLGSTTELEMQSGDVIEVDGSLTGFDVVPR